MKGRFSAIIAALAVSSLPTASLAQNQPRQSVERIVQPARVQVDSIAVGPLVQMLLRDIMRVPYVIAPEVLADQRKVSVDLALPRSEIPARVVSFIRSIGLNVELQGGTVTVSAPGGSVDVPRGNLLTPAAGLGPVNPPPAIDIPLSHLVAIPAHREVGELAEILESVMPDIEIAARGASEPAGGEIAGRLIPDALVMAGTMEDVERAQELLLLLDRPVPVVVMNAVLIEVRTTSGNGSALSILANTLGGHVQFGFNSAAAVGDNYLRLAAGGISAVISATEGDGRYRVLAQPRLSARSGSVATLNSGAQVPTLGAVSFSEEGQPIRSVVYRDSGINLTFAPVVRGDLVELQVYQERSNFERTTTGVDDSPTLNRASSSSTVAIAPGQMVVLAGLRQNEAQERRDGFLGGLFSARSSSQSQSELLVLVMAEVQLPRSSQEIQFVILGGEGRDANSGPVGGTASRAHNDLGTPSRSALPEDFLDAP